jgi:hypothetical protein
MPFNDNAIPAKRSDFRQETSVNAGAIVSAALGKAVAQEYGNHFIHQTLIELQALPVVTGNTSGISFGSKQLYEFPEGRIHILGNAAHFSKITFNTESGVSGDIAGAGSGDYSLGSTATADGVLSTTDVDLLPSSAMLDPFVAGVGQSNAGTALAAAAQFDGSATPLKMFLNTIVDDADVSDGAAADSVFFTGWIRTTWLWLGDY